MKRLFKLTLILGLFFAGIGQTMASHNQGMNITYRHINGDTFEIIIDFLRYCGGTAFSPTGNAQSAAGAPTAVTANFYCDAVGFSTSISVPVDTVIEASPICNAQSYLSSCPPNGTYQTGLLGIEWHIYKTTFAFSEFAQSTCDEWFIYTQICCRNSGTNYTGSPGLYAYCTMNQDEFPNNSAVQFTTPKPIPFFCDGQDVTYNWGAVELDGDSLWWELDTAINSWNATTGITSIPYNGAIPSTALEPIPGITIDNATGQVEFIAYIPPGFNFANYAVAVRVDEYSSSTGEYKGSVHRDVQFIVLDSCNNNPPVDPVGIQNFSGSGALIDSNTVEVCFGQDFEFDILVYDYDSAGNLSNDSITINCNIGQLLPGATYTTTGTNPDTVHIAWSAVPTNLSFVPFNLVVEDDFCPVTGFNVYNYRIRIVPSTFLGPDTAICNLDSIVLNANGGDTFNWSVLYGDPIIVGQNFGCVQCQEPWVHPQQTTAYVVTSNLSATCGNSDTIIVEVFDQFDVNFDPINGGTVDTVVYCSTDPLDTLVPVTPGGTFLGPGIVNTTAGVFAPDILDPGFGRDSTVIVTYLLEGVCANTMQRAIRVKGLPDARVLTEGPFCKFSTSEQLEGYTQGGTWSGPNTTAGGVFDPSAYANSAPDTVRIFHTVDDSGCVFTDSTDFRIINEYNTTIDSLPKVCAGEEVIIYLNDYEADPFGDWSGKQVTEDQNNPGNYYFNTAGLKAGTYEITYTIEGECGTQSSKDLVINLLPDASIFGADSVYCDNIKDSVQLSTAREDGIWGGSLVELHDGYFVPSQLGEGLYTISYELYDTVTTCYNKEIVDVRIARTPVRPKLHGGGPYCQGEGWTVRGDGLLSNTYKWYAWDGTFSDPDSMINFDNLDLLGAGNPFYYGELVDMPTVIYGTQVSKYGCESGWTRLETEVRPSPNAFFVADSTDADVEIGADRSVKGSVPFDVRFINLSGPDSSKLVYTWTFDRYSTYVDETGDPQEFTFEDIGSYFVTLVADNGRCIDSHVVKIRTDRVTNFFVPNVFTPNGDNSNDLFEWTIEGIEEFEIKIYNRWGTKVFQTDDVTQFWDGGKEPDGTYFYVVTGRERTLDAEEVEWRGDLTLIRNKE